MNKYQDIKEEFKKIGSILFQARLENSHSGNMSVRVGNRILITRRGSMLGFLKDDDIVETGLDEDDFGIALASTEVGIHRAILKNTSALAVIHTHPIYAVALSYKYDELIPIDVEGSYFLRKIPVIEFKYATGSSEMEEKLPEFLKKYPTVIVRAHGAFSIGKTLEEALYYAHITENIAEIIYLVETLGIDVSKIREKDFTKW